MGISISNNDQIKVISDCFVKPKYAVESSKTPYYLGVVDLAFLTFDPIQKGLLFSTQPKDTQPKFLDKLKDALAVSLVHFYPFAGRFSTETLPDEQAKWVYLDCTKGPGARFIHASVSHTVSDIISSVDVHPIVISFFDLGEKATNHDGHTKPLLSIQVTELIDGVFIGFTTNHSIVDGNSHWHFINSLSEVFLGLDQKRENDNILISRKPMFGPFFPDGYGPILKLACSAPLESIAQYNQVLLRERIFHFSSKSISSLKTKANEECGVSNISSFQALSAFMWRSITRARNLEPELETIFSLAMNTRPRFNPPISSDHFGNFILRDQSMCKVAELLSNGLGWASMLVHQVVVAQGDTKVRKFYEMVVKLVCSDAQYDTGVGSPLYSPNPVIIGGSTKFDMYGPEFGFGKAEAVLTGYCAKEDGKINASPGREGGGSVDLEVCLKPETMNALELDEEFMSFATLV